MIGRPPETHPDPQKDFPLICSKAIHCSFPRGTKGVPFVVAVQWGFWIRVGQPSILNRPPSLVLPFQDLKPTHRGSSMTFVNLTLKSDLPCSRRLNASFAQQLKAMGAFDQIRFGVVWGSFQGGLRRVPSLWGCGDTTSAYCPDRLWSGLERPPSLTWARAAGTSSGICCWAYRPGLGCRTRSSKPPKGYLQKKLSPN